MKNISRIAAIAALAITAAFASANDGYDYRNGYYPPRVKTHDTIKIGPLHIDVNQRRRPTYGYNNGYGNGYGWGRNDWREDRGHGNGWNNDWREDRGHGNGWNNDWREDRGHGRRRGW